MMGWGVGVPHTNAGVPTPCPKGGAERASDVNSTGKHGLGDAVEEGYPHSFAEGVSTPLVAKGVRGTPPQKTSGSGKNFSIKGRSIRITFSITIVIAMKIFKSRFD